MNDANLKSRRQSRRLLEDELRLSGAVFRNKACKCPFHEDKHASAGIYEKNGVWHFKCQSNGCQVGGDVFDMEARRTRKPLEEIIREYAGNAKSTPRPIRANDCIPHQNENPAFLTLESLLSACAPVEASYCYANPLSRAVEMVVIRKSGPDGKKFLQARPCGDGFEFGAPEKPWPIYNRARITEADAVIICEGEKCVHALHEVGIIATTSPGGAGKAAYADWQPLAGKTCYLWPDNDPVDEATGKCTGLDHMREVAAILEKLEPPPRILFIPVDELSLPPKGDAVEFLELYGNTKQAILDILQIAEPTGASVEVGELLEESIAGRRTAIKWPWPGLSGMTKSIRPGSVTMLCGDPGASKSLMILQAAAFWFKQEIPFALFELEETRGYHLLRALAQRLCHSNIADPDWPKTHADEARQIHAGESGFLDSFGRVIHCAPDRAVKLSEIAEWIEAQAAAKKRIIIVDPITAAAYDTKQSWADDLAFICRVKLAIARHGASLILVTHPKQKVVGRATMHDMAGGAAISRFAQCVLSLKACKPEREMCKHWQMQQAASATVNRRITIQKARDGFGSGREIGFEFFAESLLMEEHGTIEKAARAEREDANVESL